MKRRFVVFAVVFAVSSLLFIESTVAQFDRITTYCNIFVDDIVEGQPVIVTIQMSPPTLTGEGYKVTMWVTPPNPKDYVAGEPWLKLVVLTDSNGRATETFNVPTYSGKWYVDVMFGSSNYANHTILYLAGNWQTQFTVYPAKTPTPSSTVAPTPNPTPTPTVNITTTPYIPANRNAPHLDPIFYLLPISIILSIIILAIAIYRKRKISK